MLRVLIPSDEQSTIPSVVDGFKRLGAQVAVGLANLAHKAMDFDLVFFLWPEEFTGWRPPDEDKLLKIQEMLDWWSSRCPLAMNVNNFYPHGYEGDKRCKRLYNVFYSRMDAIVHHSATSEVMVRRDFEGSAGRDHVVATMFNYDRLLPKDTSPTDGRSRLGIRADEFVVLLLGALRNWDEITLVRQGFAGARVPRKRLLMLGRYTESLPRLRRIWRNTIWRRWLRRIGAYVDTSFVKDEDLYQYFAAADALVIPRIHDLNSGLVGLGMTFGKLQIAPNHGFYPDYYRGTENILYDAREANSLARAIEKAAASDHKRIGTANRRIADEWTWEAILRKALGAPALARRLRREALKESQIAMAAS